jgi:hypothetical protein
MWSYWYSGRMTAHKVRSGSYLSNDTFFLWFLVRIQVKSVYFFSLDDFMVCVCVCVCQPYIPRTRIWIHTNGQRTFFKERTLGQVLATFSVMIGLQRTRNDVKMTSHENLNLVSF